MSKTEKGFTLVELAVVMIVIGLLIGGVLKGQEMIENARINAVIKQVNEISAAIDTFYDQFRTKPGDMIDATIKIAGCETPDCEDGDGNGLIASNGSEGHTYTSDVAGSAFGMESIQFWKHLALADIIAGIDTAADTSNPEYGTTHLSSPMGGGYEMYFDSAMRVGAGNTQTAMHVLRLNGDITGGRNGVANTVTGNALDVKMDDGDPNNGLVFADYGASDNNCKDLVGNVGTYDVSSQNNMCVMFFKMFNR